MVPSPGATSNSEIQHLAERNQNNRASPSILVSNFTTETCQELFDTLAQWNTFLEDHVPYFQKQKQEPRL